MKKNVDLLRLLKFRACCSIPSRSDAAGHEHMLYEMHSALQQTEKFVRDPFRKFFRQLYEVWRILMHSAPAFVAACLPFSLLVKTCFHAFRLMISYCRLGTYLHFFYQPPDYDDVQ
jgi:hypothetical protein